MENLELLKNRQGELKFISADKLCDWRKSTLLDIGRIFGMYSEQYKNFENIAWSAVDGFCEEHKVLFEQGLDELIIKLSLKQ